MSFFDGVLESISGLKDDVLGAQNANKNRGQFKRDRDIAFSREDNAIQRRVADARAAGVHPLYALGASVGSSPVIGTGSNYSPTGPYKRTDPLIEEMNRATIDETRARTDLLKTQKEDIVSDMQRKSNEAIAKQRANTNQDILKVPSQAKAYDLPGKGPVYMPFRPKGEGWVTSKSAQAQQMEDEYGEVTDWTYGPYRALSDWIWYNEGWKFFVPNAVSHGVFRNQYPKRAKPASKRTYDTEQYIEP